MDDEPLKNGEVWRQRDFPCFSGFVQWIGGDEWMFMTEPEIGRCGWVVSMPSADRSGKIKYTGEELLQRLRSLEYEPCGCGIDPPPER